MVASIGMTGPGAGVAADLGEDPSVREEMTGASPRGWTVSFTTYAWLAWAKGEVAVRGRSLDVDANPFDLLNALDWSTIPVWMSYAEIRNGRLSLFNDIVYTKLAGSANFAASGPGGRATLRGNVEADYTQAVVELGAAYEVWSNRPAGVGQSAALDLIAGGRYWHQKTSISANLDVDLGLPGLPIGPDGRAIARSGSIDWFDPFIGVRWRQHIAPGQDLMLRGDVGGFGAGSDFSWHLIGTYNVELRNSNLHVWDAYIGYRALSVDYTEGLGASAYTYDVVQHGPVMGARLRF
jgi:hypothetical protein